jgi:hypothetical protein
MNKLILFLLSIVFLTGCASGKIKESNCEQINEDLKQTIDLIHQSDDFGLVVALKSIGTSTNTILEISKLLDSPIAKSAEIYQYQSKLESIVISIMENAKCISPEDLKNSNN